MILIVSVFPPSIFFQRRPRPRLHHVSQSCTLCSVLIIPVVIVICSVKATCCVNSFMVPSNIIQQRHLRRHAQCLNFVSACMSETSFQSTKRRARRVMLGSGWVRTLLIYLILIIIYVGTSSLKGVRLWLIAACAPTSLPTKPHTFSSRRAEQLSGNSPRTSRVPYPAGRPGAT